METTRLAERAVNYNAEAISPQADGNKRRRHLQLREGLLPERRKLIALFTRAAATDQSSCHIFSDIDVAERFMRMAVKQTRRLGLLVFSTLGEEPGLYEIADEEPWPEVLVVARHPDAEDGVRPLAFSDMRSAQAIIESSARASEIDTARSSLSWAVALKIYRDETGTIKLSSPPQMREGPTPASRDETSQNPLVSAGDHEDLTPPNYLPVDNVTAVRRVLNAHRWRDSLGRDFDGFNSPPGRF
jgi:hypothetical protein